MTRLPGARLRKAQIATLATFVAMGHAALSSVAWVPEFIDRLDVSFATWGTIIGLGVIGSITPLFFASRLMMRFGSRTVIRFSNYGGMIFLVALAYTEDPFIWFFINATFGFFMSLLGVSVNSHAVLLQKQISINIIGRMHAGWSLGAVGAAITGGLATVFLSLEVFLIIVAIVTVVIFEFVLRWLLAPSEDGHLEEKEAAVKRKFYQMPPELWLLAAGLFCGIYPEVAIIDWAAVFARDVLNVDVALRSIPFAAFMVGMIIGRLSMTNLATKFHPHMIASRGAYLAALALALSAVISPAVAGVSVQLGMFVTAVLWSLAGLGLAPVSPAFYSAAGHIPGVPTSWAVSRLSLVNSTVSIGAKTMMGALSQGVGLSLAFFFPIALAVGSGLIAASYAKRARRSELDAAAPPTGPISIIINEDAAR